jgi:hypothetical protein
VSLMVVEEARWFGRLSADPIGRPRRVSSIGKGGSKIKEIQEASGARLNASEQMLPGSTEVGSGGSVRRRRAGTHPRSIPTRSES